MLRSLSSSSEMSQNGNEIVPIKKAIRKPIQQSIPVCGARPNYAQFSCRPRQCSFVQLNSRCQNVAIFDLENLFGDIPLKSLMLDVETTKNDFRSQVSFLSLNKKVQKVFILKQSQTQRSLTTLSESSIADTNINYLYNEDPESQNNFEELGKPNQKVSILSIGFDSSCCNNVEYNQIAQHFNFKDHVLSERLFKAQAPVNWMLGHFSEIYQELSIKNQLGLVQKKRIDFERITSQILLKEAEQNEGNCFFYVKTFNNYLTGMVENSEIGYSINLLNILKMTKNISESVYSALRGGIPEIFDSLIEKELAHYFLNNITFPQFTGYNNTQSSDLQKSHAFTISGSVRSFDGIVIPVQITVDRINIPFSCMDNQIPFADDYLTLVRIKVRPEVLDQIFSLRSKLCKKQSARYRVLFPTLRKRKQKIDRFSKIQQSQSNPQYHSFVTHFLSKFYPTEFNDFQKEMQTISIDLKANRSRNTTHYSIKETTLL